MSVLYQSCHEEASCDVDVNDGHLNSFDEMFPFVDDNELREGEKA